jgi:hypothetical protein
MACKVELTVQANDQYVSLHPDIKIIANDALSDLETQANNPEHKTNNPLAIGGLILVKYRWPVVLTVRYSYADSPAMATVEDISFTSWPLGPH